MDRLRRVFARHRFVWANSKEMRPLRPIKHRPAPESGQCDRTNNDKRQIAFHITTRAREASVQEKNRQIFVTLNALTSVADVPNQIAARFSATSHRAYSSSTLSRCAALSLAVIPHLQFCTGASRARAPDYNRKKVAQNLSRRIHAQFPSRRDNRFPQHFKAA